MRTDAAINWRQCWVWRHWWRRVDLQGVQWDGFVKLPQRRQALCYVRERDEMKTGKTRVKTVYAVTSLSP